MAGDMSGMSSAGTSDSIKSSASPVHTRVASISRLDTGRDMVKRAEPPASCDISPPAPIRIAKRVQI